MLEAKKVFGHVYSCRGVAPKYYHVDTELFAKNLFAEDCRLKASKITLCGVGAHHQNDVPKNTTKNLTLSACVFFLAHPTPLARIRDHDAVAICTPCHC